MKENELTIIDETGKEQKCEILFTHHSEEFNKDYIVYEILEKKAITAAVFVQNEDNSGQLFPITSDEEWDMLDKLLDEFEDEGCGCGNNHSCCENDCDCDDDCGCTEGCSCNHHEKN